MKSRTLLFIATISTLIFTGCQNNDLSAENQSLKQQISEMEQQIADLEQQVSDLEEQNNTANYLKKTILPSVTTPPQQT